MKNLFYKMPEEDEGDGDGNEPTNPAYEKPE
jgi:hypothetical protein